MAAVPRADHTPATYEYQSNCGVTPITCVTIQVEERALEFSLSLEQHSRCALCQRFRASSRTTGASSRAQSPSGIRNGLRTAQYRFGRCRHSAAIGVELRIAASCVMNCSAPLESSGGGTVQQSVVLLRVGNIPRFVFGKPAPRPRHQLPADCVRPVRGRYDFVEQVIKYLVQQSRRALARGSKSNK